jgi:hypothetical protein
MDIVRKYEQIPLSDKNVLDLVDRKANLIVYPNLVHYKTLDQMLEPYGACFLLFESKPNFGHWCCIFKVDDETVEFFNPYGGDEHGYPDDCLNFIAAPFRKKSNQDHTYLSALMYNSPYELTYNEYKFQKHGHNINTCGRWCAIRLIFRFLTLDEFSNIFKRDDGDKLVTILTMNKNQ